MYRLVNDLAIRKKITLEELLIAALYQKKTAMDLFITDKTNLLPHDGEVYYAPALLSREQARHYFEQLLNNIDWKQDEVVIYGKHIVTKRKAAWYGDKQYAYTYSNTTKHALPWTQELSELKTIIEDYLDTSFNSCLLNLYHSGDEGMTWHSDDENALEKYGVIASLSLGAERKFMFKHKKTGLTVPVFLEEGSLLTMQGATQNNWLHALPKTKTVDQARINLTFRKMLES